MNQPECPGDISFIAARLFRQLPDALGLAAGQSVPPAMCLDEGGDQSGVGACLSDRRSIADDHLHLHAAALEFSFDAKGDEVIRIGGGRDLVERHLQHMA